MTGSDVLLDTSIVVDLFVGDRMVGERIAAIPRTFVNPTILGELYYGAFCSGRDVEKLREIDEFARSVTLLEIDGETAREFGRIKAELRRRGQPIPENDVWIAASARRHKLVLATRDRHFREVEGMDGEEW